MSAWLTIVLVLAGGVGLIAALRWLRKPDRRLRKYSVQVGDQFRHFLLYVPAPASTIDSPAPIALVVVFHGGGGAPRRIARASRMHELGERHGFAVAYPAGTSRRGSLGGSWNAHGDAPQGWAERNRVDDDGFVSVLIEAVGADFPLDRTRIFAAGMSKGGMLVYHLARTMPDVFAAVAIVSGTMTDWQSKSRGPISILHIHGSADPRVPLRGGRGRNSARGAHWPSVLATIDYWRKHNHCAPEPASTCQVGRALCRCYRRDNGPVGIKFCLIEGGGHKWPGARPRLLGRLRGRRWDRGFMASEAIWDYFSRHQK